MQTVRNPRRQPTPAALRKKPRIAARAIFGYGHWDPPPLYRAETIACRDVTLEFTGMRTPNIFGS